MKPELEPKVHRFYEVVGFMPAGPYKLEVTFSDGTRQVIDFEGVLEGELYGPLKDVKTFHSVKLEDGNLVWPNGVDFDPEILHDWPERRAAMVAAAARWRRYSPGQRVRAEVLDIVWSIFVGFAAGYLAKAVMHTRLGILETMLLGVIGSTLGGLIARMLSLRSETIARHERLFVVYAVVVGAVLVPVVIVSIFAS